MKSNILKYLLITSVLAGCGGSGGSNTPSSSTTGGGQGTGQNSQGGSNGSGGSGSGQPSNPKDPDGSGGSGSPAVGITQLPQGLNPFFTAYLKEKGLEPKYLDLMNLQNRFVHKVNSYDQSKDTDGKMAQEIVADHEKMSPFIVEIAVGFIEEKTDALKKEDFSEFKPFDNTSPNWTMIKRLGRKVLQYPYNEKDLLERNFFPLISADLGVFRQNVNRIYLTATTKELDQQEVYGSIFKSMEHYEAALEENPIGRLDENLQVKCSNIISKILTGSVTDDIGIRDRPSVDGQRIINGLNSAISNIAKFKQDSDFTELMRWGTTLLKLSEQIAKSESDPLEVFIYSNFFDLNPSYVIEKVKTMDTAENHTLLEQLKNVDWLRYTSDEYKSHFEYSLTESDTAPQELKIDWEIGLSIIKDLQDKIIEAMKQIPEFAGLFTPLPTALGLSATTPDEVSDNASLRHARNGDTTTGSVNFNGFSINGVSGESIELGIPLYVQLKGNVSSSKATEAATGSVAYRLGNTVIGAIQGYANSGDGFGVEGRQYETSLAVSQSFGAFFIEGQLGSVSATDVHHSNWSGMRSQVTLGVDTEFVSPFVQITHRHLDRDGLDLKQITGYVGLEMDVANLKSDSYSVDASLIAKVGYGEKAWSEASKHLGTTSGVSGSVEWKGSLHLNSGISFNTSLSLDTTSKTSASVQFSVER